MRTWRTSCYTQIEQSAKYWLKFHISHTCAAYGASRYFYMERERLRKNIPLLKLKKIWLISWLIFKNNEFFGELEIKLVIIKSVDQFNP